MKGLVKKDNKLYRRLTSPIFLEWAMMLYIKFEQEKGIKVYTQKGKYRKSFLKNATEQNVMPFLRLILSSFEANPNQNYKWQIQNLDRKINPRKYKGWSRGTIKYSGRDASWLVALDKYFHIADNDLFYPQKKLYVYIDEYKPTDIKAFFNIKNLL
jgi:hypothetical protein